MMATKGAITMAAMVRAAQTAIMAEGTIIAAGTMAIAVVAADAQVARGPVAADAVVVVIKTPW